MAEEAVPQDPGVEVQRVPVLGAEEGVRGLQRGGAQLVRRVHGQRGVVHCLGEHKLGPTVERAAGARGGGGGGGSGEAAHEGRLGRAGVRVIERRGPEWLLRGGRRQGMGAGAPAASAPAGAAVLGYQGLDGKAAFGCGLEHGRGRQSRARQLGSGERSASWRRRRAGCAPSQAHAHTPAPLTSPARPPALRPGRRARRGEARGVRASERGVGPRRAARRAGLWGRAGSSRRRHWRGFCARLRAASTAWGLSPAPSLPSPARTDPRPWSSQHCPAQPRPLLCEARVSRHLPRARPLAAAHLPQGGGRGGAGRGTAGGEGASSRRQKADWSLCWAI